MALTCSNAALDTLTGRRRLARCSAPHAQRARFEQRAWAGELIAEVGPPAAAIQDGLSAAAAAAASGGRPAGFPPPPHAAMMAEQRK